MHKRATYQYSDILRSAPHENKFAGTITAAPSKGQRSNPMKHADIPVEVKRPLRKKNNKELARLMERAGGASAPNARKFVAVLEERGVNPNLAKENVNMARVVSNDMFKKAMYAAFTDELTKLSEFSDVVAGDGGLASQGATAIAPLAVGGGIGAGIGATAGAYAGSAAANKAGLKGFGKFTRSAGGALLGLGIGGALGAASGYAASKKEKATPGFDRAATTTAVNKY